MIFIRVCFPGHVLSWRDTCNLFPIPSTVHVIAVAVMNFFTCIEVWIKWHTLVFFNRTIYRRYRCSSYEIWTIYSKKYLLCVLLFSYISSLSHWRCGGDFKCTTHSLKFAVHDEVIKWKHFPLYWPFVRGIRRSSVNSPHKGQWRGCFLWSASE